MYDCVAGRGAQWDTLSVSYLGNAPSLAGVMWWLACDSVAHFILAWYISQVFPGEFGLGRHPLFLFHAMANVLRRAVGRKTNTSALSISADDVAGCIDECFANSGRAAPPRDGAGEVAVHIANLCKSHGNVWGLGCSPPVKVLKNVDLDLHMGVCIMTRHPCL